MTTRIISYVRGSKDEQTITLDAQRTRNRAYTVAMDLEIVAEIEDAGQSAKTLDRPGLARALAMLDTGQADGLLIAKLDRLTRSVRDLGDLLDRGFATRWSLLSVGDSIDTRTAGGRLVLHVLASVAQWEREAIGERTRDALAQLKREGVALGGEALGWHREAGAEGERCAVVADDGELATLARMRALRSEGLSLRQVAATLHDEGHRTKRGGQWASETVRKALGRLETAAA